MRARAFAVIGLLFLSWSSFAQQLPASGETIDVSIINVDVFVTDRKGNRIHGLTANDFEIRENGKLQPISNFAEYAPEGNREAGTVAVTGEPQTRAEETAGAAAPGKRTIVLFVELMAQPSTRVHEVFGALRNFVDRAVRPGDAATVVSFDTRLVTRQKFTDDKAALHAALTRLEEQSIGIVRDRRVAEYEAEASDAAAAAYAASAGKGEAASTYALEQMSAEFFEVISMRRKAAAMTSLIESMSGIEGKKIMVLALHSFGISPKSGMALSAVSPIISDVRIDKLREGVMRTANANGVTLYPFHPAGMQWNSAPHVQEQRIDVMRMDESQDISRLGYDNGVLMNQTASFAQMAKETGGLMAAGPADVVELLPRVVDDLDSYYSLAYRATATGRDERRRIVVAAKNKNYEVRSRRAVVEKSDDTQMDHRVVANLFQPAEYSTLPVKVEVGALKPNGRNRWLVPVKVMIPIGKLMSSFDDRKARGSFSVFVAAGGDFGLISDVTRKRQEFTIPLADLAKAAQSSFTYTATIEVDRFADAISVGVRDNTSKDFGLARAALPSRDGAKEKRGGSLD